MRGTGSHYNLVHVPKTKARLAGKRKKKSSSKKSYPIVRKSEIHIEGSADTNAVIRIDRALSARNHRLYRQSRLYSAKVDLDANVPAGTTVDVYALGDSWMLRKAYHLAKKMFDENSAEELDQLGTTRARWNDFRVDHGLGTAFQKDMLFWGHSVPGTSYLYSGGEYLMSEVADTLGATNRFAFVGSVANVYNIIDEYDSTGNTDAEPTTPTAAVAYDGLTDEVDDNQMDHLSNDGNNPPYLDSVIRNEVWVKVGTLFVGTGGQQRLSTGFFDAPAGLVVLQSTAPIDPLQAPILNLEVKAGDYKGVHAPSMLE